MRDRTRFIDGVLPGWRRINALLPPGPLPVRELRAPPDPASPLVNPLGLAALKPPMRAEERAEDVEFALREIELRRELPNVVPEPAKPREPRLEPVAFDRCAARAEPRPRVDCVVLPLARAEPDRARFNIAATLGEREFAAPPPKKLVRLRAVVEFPGVSVEPLRAIPVEPKRERSDVDGVKDRAVDVLAPPLDKPARELKVRAPLDNVRERVMPDEPPLRPANERNVELPEPLDDVRERLNEGEPLLRAAKVRKADPPDPLVVVRERVMEEAPPLRPANDRDVVLRAPLDNERERLKPDEPPARLENERAAPKLREPELRAERELRPPKEREERDADTPPRLRLAEKLLDFDPDHPRDLGPAASVVWAQMKPTTLSPAKNQTSPRPARPRSEPLMIPPRKLLSQQRPRRRDHKMQFKCQRAGVDGVDGP